MRPPERFETEAERDAWRAGFESCARALQANAAEFAARVNQSAVEEDEEDDDMCPDCGEKMTRVLGGKVCTNCDTEVTIQS